jgi:hypothetical protein
MRMTILAVLALGLSACAPEWAPMPYDHAATLPYEACGDMGALRANLTGAPDRTPESDALLKTLGVRCLASFSPPPGPGARD